MGIFRKVTAILLVLLLLLSGCSKEGLAGILPGKTENAERERHYTAIDTANRYTCRFLEPPDGGVFRQTLQASGGLLIDVEGFSYILGDAVYMQCFAGKAESVEIYDRSGEKVRSVPVPAFEGLTWAPEYFFTGDDHFLVTASDLQVEESGKTEAENRLFRKYTADGTLLAETILPYRNGTAKWAEGRTGYACAVEERNGRTVLYLFDTDMQLLQECRLDTDINTMQFSEEGMLYIQDWKNRIRTVDPATGKTQLLLPDSAEETVQVADGAGNVYTADENGVRGNTDGTEQLLLDWDSSDLLFAENDIMGVWDKDHFLVSSASNAEGIPAWAVFEKVPEDTPVLREIVTIRPLGVSLPLWIQRAVSAFNRSSTEYRIRLWESETAYQTGMDVSFFTDQLLAEIAAGNAPDLQIMDTSSEELYLQLEKQGYLLDLIGLTEGLTGSARGAVMTGGQCFRIPYAIRYDTVFSASGEPLTAESLLAMAEDLGEGNFLFPAAEGVTDNLISCIQSVFVDRAAGSCSFDTDAFREYLEILQKIPAMTDPTAGELQYTDFQAAALPKYTLTNPELPDALAEGTVALLPVPFCTPDIYGMAKMLYPDGQGGICGYPGALAVIRQMESFVVPASGSCTEGAKAFLQYLLSEEIQTSAMVLDHYMPVTSEALEYALTYDRYYYTCNTHVPDIMPISTAKKSTEPDEYYEQYHWRSVTYTEADIGKIRSMAESEAIGQLLDPVLHGIIREEVSAYLSGDRSAEDTVRILQSRVSTYLAE